MEDKFNNKDDYLYGALVADGKVEQKSFDCKDISMLSPNIDYIVDLSNGKDAKYIEDELLRQGIITQEEYDGLKNGVGIDRTVKLGNGMEFEENVENAIEIDELKSEAMVDTTETKAEDERYKFEYENQYEGAEIEEMKERFRLIGKPDYEYSLDENRQLAQRFMSDWQYKVCLECLNGEERDIYVEEFALVANGARKAFENWHTQGDRIPIEINGEERELTECNLLYFGTHDYGISTWNGDNIVEGYAALGQDWEFSEYGSIYLSDLRKTNEIDMHTLGYLQDKSVTLQELMNYKSDGEVFDDIDFKRVHEILNGESVEISDKEDVDVSAEKEATVENTEFGSEVEQEEEIPAIGNVLLEKYGDDAEMLQAMVESAKLFGVQSVYDALEISGAFSEKRIEADEQSMELVNDRITELQNESKEQELYDSLLINCTVATEFCQWVNNTDDLTPVMPFLDEFCSEKFVVNKQIDYEKQYEFVCQSKSLFSTSKATVIEELRNAGAPDELVQQRKMREIEELSAIREIASEYQEYKVLNRDHTKALEKIANFEREYGELDKITNPMLKKICEKQLASAETTIKDCEDKLSNMTYFRKTKFDEVNREENAKLQSHSKKM